MTNYGTIDHIDRRKNLLAIAVAVTVGAALTSGPMVKTVSEPKPVRVVNSAYSRVRSGANPFPRVLKK